MEAFHRPTMEVFVAFSRVFGDKSWDSEKVLTRQSVSESEQLIWGGGAPRDLDQIWRWVIS